jgi:ABC-type cobalamin transport system permease subunit
MSKGMNDIFALVINFLGIDWQQNMLHLVFLKVQIFLGSFGQKFDWIIWKA